MKPAAVLAGALLGLASFGYSQADSGPSSPTPRFSLKLSGGAGYATLGDLGRGIEGQRSYIKDEYGDITGTYDAPTMGLSFGGELLYNFSRRLAVGLGAGYIRHAKASQVSYVLGGFIDAKERINPRLTVIPIELNLHYFFPLGRIFALEVFAGPGFYGASFDYEYRMDLSLLGLSGYGIYTFKSRRTALGFQGGVGLEVALGPRLALFVNAIGRFARIADIKGDWTEEGRGDFWDYSDKGSDDTMWYYIWTYGDKKYDQIAFQAEEPFGSLVSNVRTARIDLSGFAVTLGLKIRLF